MNYDNFDIELTGFDPAAQQFKVRLAFSDTIGAQQAGQAALQTLPDSVRAMQTELAYGSVSRADLIKFGILLGDLLMPSGVVGAQSIRELFGSVRPQANTSRGLRIRLRIEDAALADVPWEYAYIPDPNTPPAQRGMEGFLALDANLSIVRCETLTGVAVQSFDPLPAGQKVRLVALMPNPENTDKLDLPKEAKALSSALAGLQSRLQAEIYPGAANEFITRATLQQKVISNQGLHVLHFAGHGYYTREMGDDFGQIVGMGGLVFEDEAGQADLVPAGDLEQLLKGRKLRLVVLSACEGAKRDQVNAWSGVAPALMRSGIPAVVGMQFSISDPAAIAFSNMFYASLAVGNAVDDAVREGRLGIRNAPADAAVRDVQWGIGALYLRAKQDLVLFPAGDGGGPGAANTFTTTTTTSTTPVTSTPASGAKPTVKELSDVFLECDAFDTDATLIALFKGPALKPFKNGVPTASKKNQRVNLFVDYILSRKKSGGAPVLPDFLTALRDTLDEGDELRDKVDDLLSRAI